MDRDVGGRPERVLVEDVAVHLERVVDADDLARDLLRRSVHGEVGPEVGEGAVRSCRRLEVDVLDEQVVGRAHGLHRRGLALAQEDDGLVAEAAVVTAPPARNRISPRWVNSVVSFMYWFRSP